MFIFLNLKTNSFYKIYRYIVRKNQGFVLLLHQSFLENVIDWERMHYFYGVPNSDLPFNLSLLIARHNREINQPSTVAMATAN